MNDAEKILVRQSLNTLESLLNRWKSKPLKGKKLERMKLLEGAVQHLECVLVDP